MLNMLTQQKKIFVAEYLKNGMNATSAALSAGYSKRTARVQGSRLLTDVDIKEQIEQKAEAVITKLDISVERTLNEIGRLAFYDPAKFFESDGSVKRIQDMDEDSRAAIAGMEVTELFDGKEQQEKDGEKQPHVYGLLKKIKLTDKGSALDKLMRYHALYRDKLDLGGTVGVQLVNDIPRPERK